VKVSAGHKRPATISNREGEIASVVTNFDGVFAEMDKQEKEVGDLD
jgi:hypothetical protein